jgi:hypothetical protein
MVGVSKHVELKWAPCAQPTSWSILLTAVLLLLLLCYLPLLHQSIL